MPERRTWKVWVAASGGLGFAPVASGTFGTLPGVAIHAAAATFLAPGPACIVLTAAFVLCLLLAPACVAAAQRFSGLEDPGIVTLDETAGYLLGALCVPHGGWPAWLALFLLFRLFDIWKPGPIARLEKVGGVWGVMLDDLAAGLLAGLLTRMGFLLWPLIMAKP